jgi:hypothetical protein
VLSEPDVGGNPPKLDEFEEPFSLFSSRVQRLSHLKVTLLLAPSCKNTRSRRSAVMEMERSNLSSVEPKTMTFVRPGVMPVKMSVRGPSTFKFTTSSEPFNMLLISKGTAIARTSPTKRESSCPSAGLKMLRVQ